MSRRLMCPETSLGSKGFMVLHKLILEKYLANRFNEGEERGLERGREEGRKEGRKKAATRVERRPTMSGAHGTAVCWKPGNGVRNLMSCRLMPADHTRGSNHQISMASPKL